MNDVSPSCIRSCKWYTDLFGKANAGFELQLKYRLVAVSPSNTTTLNADV